MSGDDESQSEDQEGDERILPIVKYLTKKSSCLGKPETYLF